MIQICVPLANPTMRTAIARRTSANPNRPIMLNIIAATKQELWYQFGRALTATRIG